MPTTDTLNAIREALRVAEKHRPVVIAELAAMRKAGLVKEADALDKELRDLDTRIRNMKTAYNL